jgi:protein gp37
VNIVGNLDDGIERQQPEPQQPPRRVNHITLDDWNEGVRGLGDMVSSAMNRVNENIEWASFSWNPVTGCLHNCAYCYARDIANRFYPQKFEPSFLPERLSQPGNTKAIAPRWAGDTGYKNVFTCSMADLFGKWVPQEWIEAVLNTIGNNPQWDFLLLTKFPVRMAEFDYPDNVWLGTSVDYQWAVDRAEKAFTKIKSSGFNGVCWLSCEPMMERLTFSSLDMFHWVVMGGSSKSTQTQEYIPPFDDIAHLHQQARASGCKVYQKTNLIPGIGNDQRVREFPE